MNTIEINLHVNISLNDDVKSFLTGLFGNAKVIEQKPAPAAAPAKPAPAPAPTPAPATAPAKPAAAPAKPSQKEADAITIDDVRAALMKKVNNGHREVIKAKLNELGTNSVTNLSPELYKDMLDFLNSL